MMCCAFLFCFFFFKQKTAYEMRISDWSSDVCSSDLRGGEPGRDHRFTTLVRLDASFRPLESWLFPDAVLARLAPQTCSGYAWAPDGLMYASGHDRPDVYPLLLPQAGAPLDLDAELPSPTERHAIEWAPAHPTRHNVMARNN